ncbi:hypothetical protein CFP56_029347 [Quercus suber]|uniref:Uncharacterized protein n=1 Tax=Quercus suber TaxID=58331 RepID=A0AAW0LWM2_QUESU
MLELREGGSSCFPKLLVGVNVGLALVAAIIALLAFCQSKELVNKGQGIREESSYFSTLESHPRVTI